jgi:hypothetical protein
MSVQTLTKKISSLSKVHVKNLTVTSVVTNFPALYETQYHVHTTVHPAYPALNKIQLFINIISYSLINKRRHQSQIPNKNLHTKKKSLLYANKWDMRLEFILLISGQTTDKGQNPHLHMKNLIFLHHKHSS